MKVSIEALFILLKSAIIAGQLKPSANPEQLLKQLLVEVVEEEKNESI